MTHRAYVDGAEFPLLVIAAFVVRNAAVLVCLSVLALAALVAS